MLWAVLLKEALLLWGCTNWQVVEAGGVCRPLMHSLLVFGFFSEAEFAVCSPSAGVCLAVTSVTLYFLTGHGPLAALGRCGAE